MDQITSHPRIKDFLSQYDTSDYIRIIVSLCLQSLDEIEKSKRKINQKRLKRKSESKSELQIQNKLSNIEVHIHKLESLIQTKIPTSTNNLILENEQNLAAFETNEPPIDVNFSFSQNKSGIRNIDLKDKASKYYSFVRSNYEINHKSIIEKAEPLLVRNDVLNKINDEIKQNSRTEHNDNLKKENKTVNKKIGELELTKEKNCVNNYIFPKGILPTQQIHNIKTNKNIEKFKVSIQNDSKYFDYTRNSKKIQKDFLKENQKPTKSLADIADHLLNDTLLRQFSLNNISKLDLKSKDINLNQNSKSTRNETKLFPLYKFETMHNGEILHLVKKDNKIPLLEKDKSSKLRNVNFFNSFHA